MAEPAKKSVDPQIMPRSEDQSGARAAEIADALEDDETRQVLKQSRPRKRVDQPR